MATTPYPITLIGFDKMLVDPLNIPITGGSGISFVIADLNISSVLRTSTGAINRATCDITLQEMPVDNSRVLFFTPLRPRAEPGPATPNNEQVPEGCRGLGTDTLKGLVKRPTLPAACIKILKKRGIDYKGKPSTWFPYPGPYPKRP